MGFKKKEKNIDVLQKQFKIETPGLLRYDERMLRLEVVFALCFYTFILLWIVCLKFGNAEMLQRNYINLTELTL